MTGRDLTGEKFGKLTVLRQVPKPENGKGTYWECKCDCGAIKIIRRDCLTGKHGTKSCGCIRKEINHKDLTSQNFGRLTALYTKDVINGHRIWHCKCECGNECDVLSSSLLRGSTKSCGCLNRETALQSLELARKKITLDLTNQRFGKLIAIERISGTRFESAKWKCRCDCGNTIVVSTAQLTQGHCTSCGCLRSRGEMKVSELLRNNNISFIHQKTYEDLKSDKGYKLRFDFYLPEYNCCIEYQGRQHYLNTDPYYSHHQLDNDDLKREYCKNNNIKLIEISYLDYDKLDWNYIEEKLNG